MTSMVDARLPMNWPKVKNPLPLVLQGLDLVPLQMVVDRFARHAEHSSHKSFSVACFENWNLNFPTWAVSEN